MYKLKINIHINILIEQKEFKIQFETLTTLSKPGNKPLNINWYFLI